MRPLAVFLLLVGLALSMPGCFTTRAAWLPERSCAQAFVEKPQSAYQYDFRTDSRPTEHGNEGYDAYARRAQRQSCYKDWTVLVYMQADNDLTPYAYLDLYEMEAGYPDGKLLAGSTLHNDVVVELDIPGEEGTRRLHMFQTPESYDDSKSAAELLRLSERNIKSPIVAMLPPPPKGAPAAAQLHDFLRWGMRSYPAEHYLVIVWGHGQGYAPARAAAQIMSGSQAPPGTPPAPTLALGSAESAVPPRSTSIPGPFSDKWLGGIAFDYTHGTYLDIPALHDTLRAVEAEVTDGQPVDVYASDACLMQMVEVATELSDSARYISGSTQIQNFYGLPYRELLAEMNSGRYAGLEDKDLGRRLARLIPIAAEQSFAPGGLLKRLAPAGDKTLTLSSLESAALESSLLPAMQAVGKALSGYLREDPLHAAALLKVLRDTPSFLGGSQDIGAFLDATKEAVGKEAGQAPSKATLELLHTLELATESLDRSVVEFAYGSAYRDARQQPLYPDFHAVSIWLPASAADYAARGPDFSASRFYRLGQPSGGVDGQPGPWQEWLDLLFRITR